MSMVGMMVSHKSPNNELEISSAFNNARGDLISDKQTLVYASYGKLGAGYLEWESEYFSPGL